jgi:hypothetical protein
VSIPITGKLEIQFVPGGAYIDVSNTVKSATVMRPRATLDSPVQATTLTAVLFNDPDLGGGYSPYSPDSPAGAYYPNVTRDRLIRLTATWPSYATTGATATAVSSTSTSYLVATNADAADVPLSSLVRLYDGGGVLKEDSLFTVTAVPSAGGFTNITLDRPASGTISTGDQLRVVTVGTATSRRFFGWTDLWVPDAGGGSPSEATVTVTASDIISRYARRRLLSDYGEQITALSLNDYWPYDDPSDSVFLRGLAVDAVIPAAQVVQARGGTGTMSLGQADNTILVDGIASFSRGDSQSPSPVITHTLRGLQLRRVSAWIKLTVDPALANDDAIVAHDASGAIIWRLAVNVSNVPPKVQWQILDQNGTMRSQWTSGYPRDEAWHWISCFFADNAGDPASFIAVRDKSIPDAFVSGYVTPWPRDPSLNVAYLIVGGRGNPKTPGKQVNTLMGDVSSLHVVYAGGGDSSLSYFSAANFPFTGQQRAAQLDAYSFAANVLMGGGLGHGDADATPVMLTGTNQTELDAWAEHARTTGGRIITQPSGQRRWDAPSAVRPIAVSLFLDAEADLHMPAGGWQGERIERPTRVTASSPAGSTRVTDAATEALTGVRLDGPDVATAAGDVSVARSAAAWVMAGGKTRLSSFGLDATLTATDKVSSIMALLPGRRVRISNLPVGVLGYSYMDVFANGWSETYSAETQSAQFIFDTDPADDPPSAIFDDAEYGRFALPSTATITGGTCIGTVATGTVIITSTSPLPTAAGQYPMDLDWNGEKFTISGVGGGTSPQTCTVTARGVAPTVPRDTHIAGETVDIWHAMALG